MNMSIYWKQSFSNSRTYQKVSLKMWIILYPLIFRISVVKMSKHILEGARVLQINRYMKWRESECKPSILNWTDIYLEFYIAATIHIYKLALQS